MGGAAKTDPDAFQRPPCLRSIGNEHPSHSAA